ncbi:MAG: hypothetical protein ACK5OX_13960 [Desertimonas sp.]
MSQEGYDELSAADVMRGVRRRWVWIVVVAALGAVAGWVLGGGGGSVRAASATLDVTFNDYSSSAEAIDLPPDIVKPISPAAEAPRVADRLSDLADVEEPDVSFTVTPVSAESRVVITATGDVSEDRLVELLGMFSLDYQASFDTDLADRVSAVRAVRDAELTVLTDRRDELVGSGGSEVELALVSQSILDVQADLQGLDSLEALVTGRTIEFGPIETESSRPARPIRLLIAGAFGFGLLALVVVVVRVIVDRRVRRRVQVARVLPGVPVLAVFGRGDPAADTAWDGYRRALAHRLGELDIATAAVEAVGPASFAERLRPTAAGHDTEGDGVVLAVGFGAVTEDQLSAAAQTVVLAGRPLAGIVIGDVPAADVTWAAAGFGVERGGVL